MATLRATPLLFAPVTLVLGRQLEVASRLRSRVLEEPEIEVAQIDTETSASDLPSVEVEFGNSPDDQEICLTLDYAVSCRADAGDLGLRLNPGDAKDEFFITSLPSEKKVCAYRFGNGKGWGMPLKVECKKGDICEGVSCDGDQACDYKDGECKAPILKEYHVTKGMAESDYVDKDTVEEFERYKAENQPAEHWLKEQKFYHSTLDSQNQFQGVAGDTNNQDLLGTVDVLVGQSPKSNTKCVTPTVPVNCDTEAGDPAKRVEVDPEQEKPLDNTFTISVSDAGRTVCAQGKQSEGKPMEGWDMVLVLRCNVLDPCALRQCGEGAACDRRDGFCKAFTQEVIPKRLIFTGPVIPESVVDRNRRWVESGTEFRYYDDAQMIQSVSDISAQLAENGVKDAEQSYNVLRPMAFRADLWRYMILWAEGGVYLDHKLMLNAPLASLVDRSQDTIYSVKDREASELDEEGDVYWNAVIAGKKHDKGLLHVINETINTIKSKKYDFGKHFDVLYFTGPGRFSRSLQDANIPVKSFGQFDHVETLASVLDEDGQSVIIPDDSAHSASLGSSYARLFNAHSVFCFERVPDHLANMPDPCEKKTANLQINVEPFWSMVVP